jgi:tRNA-Thr(GGU) m(6)t(6)A37 methyltransferase TsaA
VADLELAQIGVVRSPVTDRRLMPAHGVPAEVQIFPEFTDGLLLIQENSHIWVVAWFEGADRDRLQIIRPTYEQSRRRRGVFGLRSTTRPNSIALTVGRLLSVSDNVLRLEALDLIDGTPVIDIKRYSPSYDVVFSARSSRDRYLLDKADPARLPELEAEAAHFHGELTAQVVAGARLIQYVSLNWSIMPKDPELVVTLGLDPALGGLADSVQALTAVTFGSGRLQVAPGRRITFTAGSRQLSVDPRAIDGMPLDMLRRAAFDDLFGLIEE